MDNNDLKKEFARTKMEKAWEAWDEAEWAFKGKKYPGAINRIYYSFYRACLALLAFEAKIPAKHSAVIAEVNRVYVKGGILPRELGRFLHHLQTARAEADYRDKNFSREEVQEYLVLGKKYLQQIEALVMKTIKDFPPED
ncbi:HEPN domain protein [Desulfofundulus kuznetsovii DSM 6115]|uniref:HEPN domain protein n=1 Tax=Desulfofundulus kuznetsovii (strain DSM 6115 / VKM B-1805 / 17) TaxID=760568 RepID=A0AAU8Q061_DESK7|nr:HEPN domain protein [Desulfofundulus kuznetsovii DSM 6115]